MSESWPSDDRDDYSEPFKEAAARLGYRLSNGSDPIVTPEHRLARQKAGFLRWLSAAVCASTDHTE